MKTLRLDVELMELRKLKDFIHDNFRKDIQVDLIVEETFINIVNYSNAQYIIVNLNLDKNLTIEFVDNGIEFNPILIEPNDASKSDKVGGRGILLLKHYSDDLIYNYINNENHLTIIKNV